MIADRDPLVAEVLDVLVPPVDDDLDTLLACARADASRLRAAARRRRTVLALAFATLVLLAGAAVAADRLDLLPFLRSSNRAEARFSVDPSHVYRGAAPVALDCPSAGAGSFACTRSVGGVRGRRRYYRATRAFADAGGTRPAVNALITHARSAGVDPVTVAALRRDLADVGDVFLGALGTVASVQRIAAIVPAQGGRELVPPAGIPTWIACIQATRGFRCRDLAAAENVAADTPIYRLAPSSDWHAAPRQEPKQVVLVDLMHAVIGRSPTRAEARFLAELQHVRMALLAAAPSEQNPAAAARTALRRVGAPARLLSIVRRPLVLPPPNRLPRDPRLTRLYLVTYRLLRPNGVDKPGVHTLFAYVTRPSPDAGWHLAATGTSP